MEKGQAKEENLHFCQIQKEGTTKEIKSKSMGKQERVSRECNITDSKQKEVVGKGEH